MALARLRKAKVEAVTLCGHAHFVTVLEIGHQLIKFFFSHLSNNLPAISRKCPTWHILLWPYSAIPIPCPRPNPADGAENAASRLTAQRGFFPRPSLIYIDGKNLPPGPSPAPVAKCGHTTFRKFSSPVKTLKQQPLRHFSPPRSHAGRSPHPLA